MADALCSMSLGYKVPIMHSLRGYLLSKLVENVNKLIEECREIWKKIGCTLMVDGWTGQKRRTLINFLVYCPKGTIFLKFVDASHASKTADMLYKLFRKVVLFVGPENVVHIVTYNAANYVAAGRLLENEFPKLFWSPCAAYCINLMLQHMVKLEEVSEVVSHAFKLTEPLARVLCIVDSENKPAIGILYKSIVKSREEMMERFQRNKKIMDPYLKILDNR
ncbi:uncharacterized protein LOC127081823 [Lathyrus oleraceus]|uniref:uncharacterized protein LOC127081823 n=1 Tax=Pisum sativum TaxID=3888 RepID=UPI0021D15A7A|nr:uncharacterized protein LOC127081823 [Pisum sativum]